MSITFKDAKNAGYYLGFNDSDQTNINERLPIKNNEWNNFTKLTGKNTTIE